MDHRILDVISSPADLKLLGRRGAFHPCPRDTRGDRGRDVGDGRARRGSSLGAVEIILAVHSMLDCPRDRFIFDVGHQAYAHKLVTGRLDEFKSLRTYGGLSGFPKPGESPYDVHPSGHASDSLSVALGLAKARDLSGGDNRVVALIGDAALSGGMAFEALNHIGQAQTPMVVILNDNEMSISRNVGALMKHLGYMRASSQYRQTRDSVQERLESSGPFGEALANFGRNMEESMKQFVLPRTMIFEQLGILCTAPIDGHDIGALKETLAMVLATDAPVLIHVVTKKGAGYRAGRAQPREVPRHRAVRRGHRRRRGRSRPPPSYTSVFGEALAAEARKDERIVAITAAMKDGTGLAGFAEEFPSRFVDSGIAEEHAVGLASGLAIGGKKPDRGHLLDVPPARGGPADHQQRAAESWTWCSPSTAPAWWGRTAPRTTACSTSRTRACVPHMRVLAPSNEAELVHALHTALALGGPFAIRYPRGAAEGVPLPEEPQVLEVGKAQVVREGADVAILAVRPHGSGRALQAAVGAAGGARHLMRRRRGHALRRSRIDSELPLEQRGARSRLVVTVEGGIVVTGGVGRGRAGRARALGAGRARAHAGHPRYVRAAGQGRSAACRPGPRPRGHRPLHRGAHAIGATLPELDLSVALT